MGIFSGIEILFYVLGIMTAVFGFVLYKLNKSYHFEWYLWLMLGTGMLLAIFTIAWSVSSFLEGEVQAGNMGLVMFGLPALILFGATKKFLKKNG